MMEYWDSKFKDGGSVWGSEPAESAIMALQLFREEGIRNILIPGFGYGRNARLFTEAGFEVTGIEISAYAIETAMQNNIRCKIYHESVTSMPVDNIVYDAVFCYALVHLLNKSERQRFLRSCFSQLRENGLMIFVASSRKMGMYGRGRLLSEGRYEIERGLKVYFYNAESIKREFSPFGLNEFREIEEPVKFMPGADPLKLWYIICKK